MPCDHFSSALRLWNYRRLWYTLKHAAAASVPIIDASKMVLSIPSAACFIASLTWINSPVDLKAECCWTTRLFNVGWTLFLDYRSGKFFEPLVSGWVNKEPSKAILFISVFFCDLAKAGSTMAICSSNGFKTSPFKVSNLLDVEQYVAAASFSDERVFFDNLPMRWRGNPLGRNSLTQCAILCIICDLSILLLTTGKRSSIMDTSSGAPSSMDRLRTALMKEANSDLIVVPIRPFLRYWTS